MTVSLKTSIAGIRRTSTCNSAKSVKSMKGAHPGKRKPVRRALIVAIVYRNKEGEALPSPHKDALAWQDTLIKKYGYAEGDITMMMDDEDTLRDPQRSHLVPLKDNIIRELKALVHGAKSGDRFMFYYAGHGIQIETEGKEEEDGFDEAIVPYSPDGDGDPILDNTLRNLLVDPLPRGTSLTAIFDSCCSGTLLDLEHYACNNVYFPWVNRGKRDLRCPNRAFLRRKNDEFVQVKVELKASTVTSVSGKDSGAPTTQQGCVRICERKRAKSDAIIKHDQVISDRGPGRAAGPRFVVTRSSTLEIPRRRDSDIEKRKARRVFSIPHKFSFKNFFRKPPQYAEPESYLSTCDGFSCREEETNAKPDVISISACRDPEQTWDSKKGLTLTRAMVKLLNKWPHMPVRQLIERTGHAMYRGTTLRLHRTCQRDLKQWRAEHSPQEELGKQFEILNSPMPQLGSTNVLAVDQPFCA